MDPRENLRNMLNNIINDNQEAASLDLHDYLKAKMRDTVGLPAADTTSVGIDSNFGDGENDDIDNDDESTNEE